MNRLGKEKSPYLQQHADNPVDWYPWCDEAFERAVREDKPVLLSIGYSACHWCHVMAHECFENSEIAEIMNEKFINIKVDREERPDIDDIYMQSVQSLGAQGGWPLTAILMPDGSPFFGGTYFPPVAKMGLPSFPDILEKVSDAYMKRRDELQDTAGKVKDILSSDAKNLPLVPLDEAAISAVFKVMVSNFDWKNGGFGSAPKFPQSMALEFLMRYGVLAGEEERKISLKMVNFTLKTMARGGIYDQVGGGFHRYSVDEKWRVPHFEKMLYDNAQLSRLYVNGWKLTGDRLFKFISEDINNYLIREMLSSEGGFFSASDADSEGVEGKFFVWSEDEFRDLVGDDYDLMAEYWGVNRGPDFDDSHILNLNGKEDELASKHDITESELASRVENVRRRLYEERGKRPGPHLDSKIVASWNGMIIAALAEGARAFERKDYLDAACRAGNFIFEKMRRPDGSLYRVSMDGIPSGNGYLEDYANVIDAMIELYQSTAESLWIERSVELAEFVVQNFRDKNGLFYDSGPMHEKLFVKPRNIQDNALPSGNSKISKELLRIAVYTGNGSYFQYAEDIIRSLSGYVVRYPLAFSEALNSAVMILQGLSEVVISGKRDSALTVNMRSTINRNYIPGVLSAFRFAESGDYIESVKNVPFYEEKVSAYLCRNQTCSKPVSTVNELEELLAVS